MSTPDRDQIGYVFDRAEKLEDELTALRAELKIRCEEIVALHKEDRSAVLAHNAALRARLADVETAEKYEREAVAAFCEDRNAQRARADKAERERDEAKDLIAFTYRALTNEGEDLAPSGINTMPFAITQLRADLAAARAEINRMMAQQRSDTDLLEKADADLKAAREDSARLDLLERHANFSFGRCLAAPEDHDAPAFVLSIGLHSHKKQFPAQSLRAAIDKAREDKP